MIFVFACALSCLGWSYAAAQESARQPQADSSGAPAASSPRPAGESGRAVPVRPPPRAPEMPDIDQVEPNRPSGFWTSTRPARGGAYRYRLLAIGVVVLAITLAWMVWLVRRKMREPAPEIARGAD